MKKFLLFIFILGTSSNLFAQLAVKLTPLVITQNKLFTVHGEIPLFGSKSMSLCLGVSPNFMPKSIGQASDSIGGYYYSVDYNKSTKGFSVDPEIRFYSRKLMQGFYVGAYSSLRYSSSLLVEYHDRDTIHNFLYNPTGGSQKLNTLVSVYGITMGYQKVYGKNDGFLIDVYGGWGKKFTQRTYETAQNIHSVGYQNSLEQRNAIRLNISIGYFFSRKDAPTTAP
jgi:hypothetical protein